MPKDRKFVNPLTQATTTETETEVDTQMPIQVATDTSIQPPTETTAQSTTQMEVEIATHSDVHTDTYTPRKRGKQKFEYTHERISLWLDKRLKKQFYALAKKYDLVLTALLDEAIADVLKKYEEHPPD